MLDIKEMRKEKPEIRLTAKHFFYILWQAAENDVYSLIRDKTLSKFSFPDYSCNCTFRLHIIFQSPAGSVRHNKKSTYMKHVVFTLLMVVTSTLVFSQSNDEQSVRQTLDQMTVALKSNNADAIGGFYADDYTFVSPQGVLFSKTQRLDGIKSGQTKYESFEYSDSKVRIYGDIAIVNTTAKVKMNGQDANTALVTLAFVKKGDHWLVVAAQATPLAK